MSCNIPWWQGRGVIYLLVPSLVKGHPMRCQGCTIWTLWAITGKIKVFMGLIGLDLGPGAAAALATMGAMQVMLEPSILHWERQREYIRQEQHELVLLQPESEERI